MSTVESYDEIERILQEIADMEVNDVKKAALCSLHKELGAKLVDFAGVLKCQLVSVKTSKHVRNSSGIFDVSHMGMVHLKGPMHYLFTACLYQ